MADYDRTDRWPEHSKKLSNGQCHWLTRLEIGQDSSFSNFYDNLRENPECSKAKYQA